MIKICSQQDCTTIDPTMLLHCRFLLFLALSTSLIALAKPLGRWSVKGRSLRQNGMNNLTRSELYAIQLMHRQPTRRATALRRQTSDLPPVTQETTAQVQSSSGTTFSSYYSAGSWELATIALPDRYQYSESPSSTEKSQQEWKVVYRDPNYYPGAITSPYIGLSSCSDTASANDPTLYLKPGSSNFVCATNLPSSTSSASTPVLINAVLPGISPSASNYAIETDIWTMNYVSGAVTPQWINPDGTSYPTHMFYEIYQDPSTGKQYVAVYATGDLDAALGNTERFPDGGYAMSLSFK